MSIQALQFTYKLILHTFILVLMAISQASAGFAICVAQPGHVEIEYANSACCNPAVSSQSQADELIETDAPDCAACIDYDIGSHSLLRNGGHFNLNYSTHQNTGAGKFLVTNIIWNTPESFYYRVTPDSYPPCQPIPEISSSPLRC